MESLTKSKITVEQQDHMVSTAFGSQVTIVQRMELTGGYFNAAYDLQLSNGRGVILKIAPAAEIEILSYEHNIMLAEVEALKLIKAKGIVPVPQVIGYDTSRTIIPCDYFFMEKIIGQPYNEIKDELTVEERAAIESELGRYNRIINEIRGERFGLFSVAPQAAASSWRDTFMYMFTSLLEDARRLGAEMPITVETIEASVATISHVLDEVTEPRLIHWDLWDGNVFVRDGRIVALIDWERALWGDPLMEYYFRYIENSEHFCRGYGRNFDSPNESARKNLYDLYIDLIYFIECYSRKYDSVGHLQWAHDNLLEGWERFQEKL
ncbi:aminoglycoside phosphotransferase family protein [Paenibacillus sp. 19GGS1-52]|uniref:phosphotransferase family protein n=1 Tax=Paenibacillus sp. 19GGS1-52 TaxID=2758563 RepID=UPI001EFAEB51|nr:aminoglycoside phosphotransferase family protein [Paenibacillus sp. 19GGS1-52]